MVANENSLKYTIANARENFSELVNMANYRNDRVEIVKRNKTVAYIVSKDDFELIQKIEDFLDAKEADAILSTSKGTISHSELFKDLGIE
jgi:prevent-host-death family protein